MDDAGDNGRPPNQGATALPLYVDGRITGGGHGGIVNVTLGTILYSPDGESSVVPAVRLRMTAAIARSLAADLMSFAERSKAPPQPKKSVSNKQLN